MTTVDTSAVLARAAAVAGHAPSIHNTQPWHWRVRAGTLELATEPTRRLAVTDPDGRMMVVSAGAALHHARVALAGEGWRAEVERLIDRAPGADPLPVARLTLLDQAPATPAALRQLHAIPGRHTDRRPVGDAAVSGPALEELRAAAEAEGARWHQLRPDEILDLAAAAARAQEVEALDPQWTDELGYWAGAAHPAGLGIPAEAIPEQPPRTTVPAREFGPEGRLPIGAGHDRAASYALLYGDEDTPRAWLRGGEALSAVWLTATGMGLSVMPMSAAVEVDGTRQVLRRLLAHLGYPVVVLRLGRPGPDPTAPPPTPRLPATQTVEVVEG